MFHFPVIKIGGVHVGTNSGKKTLFPVDIPYKHTTAAMKNV
jgi:hypothetical protein